MNKAITNEAQGNVHINVGENNVLFKHNIIGELASQYVPTNGTVLDVGCGLGQTLKVLRSFSPSAQISIADAYQICLEKTSSVVEVQNKYLIDEMTFDLSAIPDNSYDVVILSHVLEHLRYPIEALTELTKKISPNGVAIVVVPNVVRPEVFAHAALRRHYVNRGHVYAWDRSHWINFIEKICELNVQSYESDFIRFPGHNTWPLNKLSISLAKLFPNLSNGNIAIIRK